MFNIKLHIVTLLLLLLNILVLILRPSGCAQDWVMSIVKFEKNQFKAIGGALKRLAMTLRSTFGTHLISLIA